MFKQLKTLNKLDKEFHKIAGTLRKFELQKMEPDSDDLGLADIFGDMDHKGGSEFFLGFYTRRGVETALDRYGIWDQLRAKGFDRLRLELDLSDPYRHRLMVFDGDGEEESDRLVDLHLHRLAHPEERDFADELAGRPSDFLMIDWLELQNPRIPFEPDRPPLPSQKNPGLGIGAEVMELLQIMAERLGLAGLVTRPNHYHNAALYSLRYHFIAPCAEGRLRAAMRDLAGYSLADASWAVYLGAVIDEETGEAVQWSGREQMFPIDRRIARYFETADYRRQRQRWKERTKFRLDEALYEKLKRENRE